jgi:hypothetical protein
VPAGVTVERVTGAEQLANFERTLCEAYPVDELLPYDPARRWFVPAALETPWHLFVAYRNGVPVATAGAFAAEQVVAVEAVSCRAEARGCGIGAAITDAASSIRPDLPVALVSSDLGRGVYERIGYSSVLRYTLWVGQR